MQQFNKKIEFSGKEQEIHGAVCPMPAKGAVGSAVLTIIL